MAEADSSILGVLLFGSRARGEEGKTSDTDVALVLDPGSRDPLELSELKHRYLSRLDLDIHVFQQLPLHMQHRVLRDGRVLYVRDEELLYKVASRSVQRYEDFRHLHDAYLADVAHG
jgi:predicted nucleotidyltransferase